MNHEIEHQLKRIADSLGYSSFEIDPEAFYGPYTVSYIGRFFPETIETWEQAREEREDAPCSTADGNHKENTKRDGLDAAGVPRVRKGDDPYKYVRENLLSRPGFVRPPDGRHGILVQGWILKRFRIPPTLTPGHGWIISGSEARKMKEAKPEKPPKGEPTEAQRDRTEARKAKIQAKKRPGLAP